MKNSATISEPFFSSQSKIFNLLLILATTLIAFIGAPLFFLTPEQAVQTIEYSSSFYPFVLFCYFSVCFFFVIFAIYKITSLATKSALGSFFVGFAFSWVVLSAFLLPLTTDGGMFEAEYGATNWRNLILLVFAALFSAGALISKHSKIAIIFFAIFIGTAISPKLLKLLSEFNTEISVGQIQLSKNQNIILIGLDGIPGQIAMEVLAENPDLNDVFGDFTRYTNAVATSPATEASLLGAVLGNADYTDLSSPTKQKLKNAYFNNSEAYNYYTNEAFYGFNLTGTKVAVSSPQEGLIIQNLIEVYKRTMLRLFTNIGAKTLGKTADIMLSTSDESWKNSSDIFDNMSTRFETASERPSIVHMHFDFTHHPVTLDENCVYRSGDPNWKMANQNERGIKNLTICGLGKLAEFVKNITKIDVYDNSDIIFYSDHGKPAGYFSTIPHNLRINNNPHWGYNRYRPMLMIKPAGVKQEGTSIDNRQILLDDLAKTMCQRVEPKSNCQDYSGLDLLDPTDQSPTQYFIHVVKDEKSTWERRTHIAVELSRNEPLLDALRANQSINLSETSTADTPITGGLEK